MAPNPVIVVGGGLSGLSAAHTLLERGCSVILLDKNGFMGGNSTKATSGINGAGTATQHDEKIPDSAKIFFADTKKSARDLARDDLIQVLTGRSGDAVNWLVEKFDLDLTKVARLGGHSQPRTHRGTGGQFPGMAITFALMEKLEDLAVSIPERVTVLKKARVTGLIKEGDVVTGVDYEVNGEKKRQLGPVILATGGYAADFTGDSLLKKYRPDIYDLPTTNGDHCTGDGHKLAIASGAKAIDMEKVQVHPTGLVDPNEPDAKVKFLAAEALRGVGGILLDNEGQRFCDELGHRDYVTGEMNKNGKYPIRLILNGEASKEIDWHCKHYVGRGLMKNIKSGDELAKEMGLDKSVLQKTFDKYNDIAASKKDPYGKKFFPGGKWSLSDTTFHVAHMTPVLHYTMGGLEIDAESRILNDAGKPLPGLFACGEIAGGVHGANRLGGSSLLGCVVFGRVAGDTAAAYLMQQSASQRATERVGALAGHLMETKITIAPGSSVKVELSWVDAQGKKVGSSTSSSSSSSSESGSSVNTEESIDPKEGDRLVAGLEPEKLAEEKGTPPQKEMKTYTRAEVAKHKTKDDIWVIIDGDVLNCTEFLSEHPGGEKAILLYGGRDATEEFDMLHERKVIPRYAPNATIGKVSD